MTVKQLSTELKISPQAVYKRLKAAGVALDGLKSKETGDLTAEGEETIRALFFNQVDNPQAVEVEKLRVEVERLKSEVEYLRKALDQAQQLQAMALQRPALPPAGLISRIFGRGRE